MESRNQDIAIRDVVYVIDETLPNIGQWPSGLIQLVYLNADGVVHKVDVQVETHLYCQPIIRLVKLLVVEPPLSGGVCSEYKYERRR